jgi:YjbR protein
MPEGAPTHPSTPASTHPPRFDDGDPLLAEVRRLALAFPEAKEKISHGSPNFYTVKVFAIFGGSLKGDHYATVLARAVLVLPDPGEREALLEDPRVHVPAYLGPSGWIALDLTHGDPDWQEVGELLESSYRNTAPRRLVRVLDEA